MALETVPGPRAISLIETVYDVKLIDLAMWLRHCVGDMHSETIGPHPFSDSQIAKRKVSADMFSYHRHGFPSESRGDDR